MFLVDFFLKRFVWMLFPALIMLTQIGIEVFVPDRYMADLHSETGPHEYLQALILCPAVFLALRLVTIAPSVAIRLWGGLALCGSIYVLGEELSWGQHWFEWATPEYWKTLNDQEETNLHNTSSWLDQKPRMALEVGVIVCGILIPLLQKFYSKAVPKILSPILGSVEDIPCALFFVFLKVTDKSFGAFDRHLFWRSSEVEEIYLFLFVVIYLAVLCRRFQTAGIPETAASGSP